VRFAGRNAPDTRFRRTIVVGEDVIGLGHGQPARQLDFAGYRQRQAADPELTLRRHLLEHGGAIEV
jgi:hypothetical protein